MKPDSVEAVRKVRRGAASCPSALARSATQKGLPPGGVWMVTVQPFPALKGLAGPSGSPSAGGWAPSTRSFGDG